MRVTTLDSFPAELDDLALRSPHATFYHSGVWLDGLIAAYPALNFRCLLAEQDGVAVGYLPYSPHFKPKSNSVNMFRSVTSKPPIITERRIR